MLLIAVICAAAVTLIFFFRGDEVAPGLAVHADRQSIEAFKQIFPQYIKMGSNWKFRDSNSVFIHVIGDSLKTSDTYLFPGRNARQLIEETEQQGILFWKSRPSLLWISAKDLPTLNFHLQNNPELRQRIDEVAHNFYVKGSYANITGKDTVMKFIDFDAVEFEKRPMQRYQAPLKGRLAGIYDLDAIQYDRADIYVRQGLQSTLKKEYLQEIHSAVGNIPKNWSGVLKLLRYCDQTFEGGGICDYRVSANDLFQSKRIGGCTEEALIVASILRGFGFPSLIIYTVDLDQAMKTPLGQKISKGHQMVEVFVNKKWILIAGNREYVEKYDPYNPYIVRYKPDSSIIRGFVLAKGLDYWDMGIVSGSAENEMETEFLKRLDSIQPFLEIENKCKLSTY